MWCIFSQQGRHWTGNRQKTPNREGSANYLPRSCQDNWAGRKEEGEKEREIQGGSSRDDQCLGVWRAWKMRKCISSLSPGTCSCQDCYLLWWCRGSRGRAPGAQGGFLLPKAGSSHPFSQKRMWNPASPSCLETELSGKVLRKGLKTCPLQQV